ncbi:MAG: type II secretion system protein, partial [Chloroflexi bacterium CG_4_8_14_3_um_filter_45_15]
MKHIKSLMQKVGKGEGGFTLIELLIVIVILGIIAAVVVLNIGGFLGTGVKEAAYMEKDVVQTAVLAAM